MGCVRPGFNSRQPDSYMKIILSFFGGFLIGAAIIAIVVFFFVFKSIPDQKLPDNNEANAEEGYFDLTSRTEVLISIFEEGFQPRNIVIKRGTKVLWKNESSSQHYPKLSFFEDKPLEPGGVISHVFNESGVYIYRCGVHGDKMNGKITVE